MALTPLTRVQQATVVALVEARRLDVVPADLARAASFLHQAEERLNQLPPSPVSSSSTASPTTPATTRARRCWRRTASGRPTGPASTRPSAATCAPSSTSRPRTGRRESSTVCAALVTRTVTRRSRWVPRRRRRPSRSPGRSSTKHSPEASRPDRRSATSPQGVRSRPMIAIDARRSRDRVSAVQVVFSGSRRRRPATVDNAGFRSASP